MSRKRVAILGSTGSIGRQTLDVCARHRERFEIVGLAVGKNTALLAEQVAAFAPAVVSDASHGPAGLRRVAIESAPEILVVATDGFVAFDATFEAVERGIDIAVANKELIVGAGELLVAQAATSGSRILPVDSEHSALFQCLLGEPRERIAALVLTASGGPFWELDAHAMASVTLQQALAHPTWAMGIKNTIDSATLMNKGLEVIEAARLFGLASDRVRVLVHRTSIAHGFAMFTDGNVKAQLAPPDMRLPIGYALAYPDRLPDLQPRDVDPLVLLGAAPGEASAVLRFERPDTERFPCLQLAYDALDIGGTAPAALSAANEIAVESFVEGKIGFREIARVVRDALDRHTGRALSLDAVREADRLAREHARDAVRRAAVKG